MEKKTKADFFENTMCRDVTTQKSIQSWTASLKRRKKVSIANFTSLLVKCGSVSFPLEIKKREDGLYKIIDSNDSIMYLKCYPYKEIKIESYSIVRDRDEYVYSFNQNGEIILKGIMEVEEEITEEVEEVVVEEPVIEEPVIEELVIEEPVIEESVIEEPVNEKIVVEETAVEEVIVERAKVEKKEVKEKVVKTKKAEKVEKSEETEKVEVEEKVIDEEEVVDKEEVVEVKDTVIPPVETETNEDESEESIVVEKPKVEKKTKAASKTKATTKTKTTKTKTTKTKKVPKKIADIELDDDDDDGVWVQPKPKSEMVPIRRITRYGDFNSENQTEDEVLNELIESKFGSLLKTDEDKTTLRIWLKAALLSNNITEFKKRI